MNTIAFVLNLASSKHCDTSEKKMFYCISVWVFSTASLDKNNKKNPKSNFYNEINTKSSKDQEALKKKKLINITIFREKQTIKKVVLIKKHQLIITIKKLANSILVGMCVNL